MKHLSMFALVLLTCCCRTAPPPTPPTPEPVPTSLPAVEASCASACENQRELNCEVGKPTPNGATCEEVCENSSKAGIPALSWDVRELTESKRCDR